MFSFSHVGIVVQDMDASVKFYTEVLGCELHTRHKDETIEFALLKVDGQAIELLKFAEDAKERKEGVISHIAFGVEDLQKEIDRLKELGLELEVDEPREVTGGLKIFFFKGPSGESIEYVQKHRKNRAD